MYPLGEQFKINYDKAKSNEKAILKGKKYRITILTERLIRLEYSDDGVFEDRPTKMVFHRDIIVPLFTIRQDFNFLEVTSKYIKLTYTKEKPFNSVQNLKIELLKTDRIWNFGHPEVRNYKAPKFDLISDKGKVENMKGLYSADGFVSLDDSEIEIFEECGTLIPREKKKIDTYVFLYNNDFTECLKDYFYLTGNSALIPRYALGVWWNREIPYKQEVKQTYFLPLLL